MHPVENNSHGSITARQEERFVPAIAIPFISLYFQIPLWYSRLLHPVDGGPVFSGAVGGWLLFILEADIHAGLHHAPLNQLIMSLAAFSSIGQAFHEDGDLFGRGLEGLMISDSRRGVEEGEAIGEHILPAALEGVIVRLLELLKGDALLRKVSIELLAGVDAPLDAVLLSGSVVGEGAIPQTELFLFQEG
jgi:hypothetical protein